MRTIAGGVRTIARGLGGGGRVRTIAGGGVRTIPREREWGSENHSENHSRGVGGQGR